MPSSIIRTPATPNLSYSEKTRHLSKSRPYRLGGKGLIASTDVEIPSPPISFFLGSPYPSSWPLCFCVNQNSCPYSNPGAFGNQLVGWICLGYSSTNWIIKGLNIGRNGYLFVYRNSSFCGINIGSNQGPAQVVTAWSLNQINSFNNPDLLLPGIQSISQFILDYVAADTTKTIQQLLPFPTIPGVVPDPTIYYITPTPLYFITPANGNVWHSSYLPYAPAPHSAWKCIYISTFFSWELGIFSGTLSNPANPAYSDLSLENLSVSNLTTATNATLVISSDIGFEPYIYFPGGSGSVGYFTFNAYQPFYQSYGKKISFLATQLSVTASLVTP